MFFDFETFISLSLEKILLCRMSLNQAKIIVECVFYGFALIATCFLGVLRIKTCQLISLCKMTKIMIFVFFKHSYLCV